LNHVTNYFCYKLFDFCDTNFIELFQFYACYIRITQEFQHSTGRILATARGLSMRTCRSLYCLAMHNDHVAFTSFKKAVWLIFAQLFSCVTGRACAWTLPGV